MRNFQLPQVGIIEIPLTPRTIPLDSAQAIRAPRLSAFMVDTARCLHMGSRVAPGHERLLYTATYISIPRLYPEPPPCFQLTGGESQLLTSVLSST